jgi:hypothetical protein
MLFGETVVVTVRTIQDTHIHSLGRMQSFRTLNVVYIVTTGLKRVKLIGYEDMDWMYVAQNGDECCTLVNSAINYKFNTRRGH